MKYDNALNSSKIIVNKFQIKFQHVLKRFYV